MVDIFIVLTAHCHMRLKSVVPDQKMVIKPNTLSLDAGPGRGGGGYGLFLGRLAEEKGIRCLIEGWRLARTPVRLKIAGLGPLQELVAAACVGHDDIEYVGWKSRQEAVQLLGEAEFLILPSEWEEPMSMVLLEAFSRGVPVLGAAVGGIPDGLMHGHTGLLFRSGDPNQLARAVEWASSHTAEMVMMRRNARAEFETKYMPETNYRQLVGVYQSLTDPVKVRPLTAEQLSENI
jgi:glycosyltransferase involved in cell wall biosynthesis